ncbi:MAG: AraC family transcriptional regulator [Candidatus Kuenenia stuttgartiensis]|nr:AraC family transcriptional regulator [Candidatus Kuenenia stuttgartiensis]
MFNVSELRHGIVDFAKHNPREARLYPDFYLPGSSAYESDNVFGNFFYQFIEQKHFSIWKSIYAPKEDVTLRIRQSDPWLGFRLMLKKHIRHLVFGHTITLMQGQLDFAYNPYIDHEFRLRKGEVYEVFDMQVTPSLLKKLRIKEQRFERFLERMGADTPERVASQPTWGNVIVLDAIDYLTKSPFKETVAEEVVRQVIGALTREKQKDRNISEQQLENLYAVRDQIRSQFADNMHLQQWATMAQMNITYFKEMFSQVFELTPYHYLLYERIKAAKEMMIHEPDLTFSEVARRCGFSTYNNLRRAFAAKENKTLSQWRNLPDFLAMALAWELALEDVII